MTSLLGTMDTIPATTSAAPARKGRKRKSSVVYEYDDNSSSPVPPDFSSYRKKSSYRDTSSDGLLDDGTGHPSSDDQVMSPNKKIKMIGDGMTPATERLAHLDVHGGSDDYDTSFDAAFDDVDMDVFMDVDEDGIKNSKLQMKTESMDVNLNKKLFKDSNSISSKKQETDSIPSWLSVYDSLSVSAPDSLGPLTTTATSSVNPSKISALEADGSLRFFWLDYLELEGRLYFIGKLKDKASGAWVSCCVTVEGIERNLFVLPQQKRMEQDEDGELYETDMVPGMQDVYNDFDMIRKKVGIKSWKGKFVKRKYAFGESDVPREESQWLKVVYGFNGSWISAWNIGLHSDRNPSSEPQVPMSACSPNISRIFGTNTSAFELLVLKRKIMGPCWLQIKNPQIESKGVGFCLFNYST
jgi:DNA polymerase alpha subunit A